MSQKFSVYFDFYVVIILGKLKWWYMVFYLLPREMLIFLGLNILDLIKILSNGRFNDTCLLLFSFYLFIYLSSYLKVCSLKIKLNIVARLIKCKIIESEVWITKYLLRIIASIWWRPSIVVYDTIHCENLNIVTMS